jgi:sortase family protein
MKKTIKKKPTFSLVIYIIALLMVAYPLYADYKIYENKKQEINNIDDNFTIKEDNDKSSLNLQTYDLEVLGVVYIPKIDITLPIYKTKYETERESSDKMRRAENYGAALWYKLDNINDGKGSRALLSSHNGLSIGDLFTNIPKLTFGDKFYVKLKGEDEIFAYQVFEIDKSTMSGDTITRDTYLKEEKEIKRIQYDEDSNNYNEQTISKKDYKGFDEVYDSKSKRIKGVNKSVYLDKDRELLTLQTCIPIFINSQRLLVTGERIPYDGVDIKENTDIRLVNIAFLIVLLLILFLIIKLPFNIINNIKYKKIKNTRLDKKEN